MLYNIALARNFTFRCLCFPQAFIPLSYAAQIPTTPDPDLANVRLSVSKVDHQVQYHRVMRALLRVYFVRVCVRKCVSMWCAQCVLVYMCNQG